MSGRLGYATANATAITHRIDTTAATASPNVQKMIRKSQVSHTDLLGVGAGLRGPSGRVESGIERDGVTAHYKK
jgi:hypothetical protein